MMEMELLDSLSSAQQPQQQQEQQQPQTVVQRHPNQNLTRPNSLLGPEKEPIKFQINLVGAPAEVEQLIEHIKDVASQFLYHWKTFPINLPQPISTTTSISLPTTTGPVNASNVGTNRKSKAMNLRDLFIMPPFDELDAVAADSSGEPRRLTNSQLKSLRERGLQKEKFGKSKKLNAQQLDSIQTNGEFDVPSLNFPGQVHLWKLSQFLQKGSEPTRETLLDDLALAARFIVITARMRIIGHFFSVKEAAKAFLAGLLKLVDMVIGLPSLLAHNLENKVKEERCRYLVAELVCRPEYRDGLESLCKYVKHQIRRATMEKFDLSYEANAQPVPYNFLSPCKKQEIDLRLFSKDIMRKALPILVHTLEKETRGWFLPFRERLIAEMREKKMTDVEIEEEVNDAVMKEYLQRVYTSILSNAELEALGRGVPQLLVQQAQTVVIMHKAIEKVKKDIKKTREVQECLLKDNYPVLARIKAWMNERLELAEMAKIEETLWAAHEEAVKICLKHNLQQSVYFLNRDLVFMKDRESVLIKELRNAKKPTRTFVWSLRIWNPSAWIIKRNFQGQSEIIPTVISQHATSVITPRSDPSQPVFLVEKEITRTTTSRWPMWRLLNWFQRTWTWTWNIIFLLGFVVPWSSPLGLRALFFIKPFMSDLELSQINGTLFPRKTSMTKTMASRLIELWRHISKARTHFETEPDTGFIGKGMTRHLNRVWNYFVKGFLGSLLILFVFPLVCISVSLTSILFAIAAPIWIPCITTLLHIYMMLVYDLDSPNDERNKYCILLEALVWDILIQGIIQPLIAVFIGSIVCPLISLSVLIVGVSRYWLRIFWDSMVFHLFIKKCGRIPSSDSIAVKRISGPGLAQEYYFIITSAQALAALEAKMEIDELEAFQKSMETVICQPQKDFQQFIEACFGPFSAQLSKSGQYRQLERESQNLLSSLHEKLEKRRRELQLGLQSSVKTRVRMNTVDLKAAIQIGAYMLEKFYPSHVIGRLTISEEEFWEEKFLAVGDWAGLASLLYADIFSLDCLTPLTDADIQFKLEPNNQLDLSRYVDMVQNTTDIMGINGNGPDLLGNVYAPRGNIRFQTPYLEVSAFNPRSRFLTNCRRAEKRNDKSLSLGLETLRVRMRRNQPTMSTNDDTKNSWKPWKRSSQRIEQRTGDKLLLIPLPIPHPVHIAISIYNRDSDQPIPIDSDMCWDILRSIEECYGDMEAMHSAIRYRGSETTGMESSNDSLDSVSSTSGGEIKDIDSRESVDGTETLPCTNANARAVLPCNAQITITSNNVQEIAESINSIGNFMSHSNSSNSITPTNSSYHWTLSNLESSSRRNNAGMGGNNETVRVDLASPEDISISMDEQRVVCVSNSGTFGLGTTV